tara:strand:- start:9160 stop:10896 length:1737 start_codon:yes stop_codon:yes gene_type:complete
MSLDITLDDVSGDENAVYEVIQIHVSEGDFVKKSDVVLIVEGDKSVIEITPQTAGVVEEILIKPGQKVSNGVVYMVIEPSDDSFSESEISSNDRDQSDAENKVYDLAIIGSGPGGYTAAFRAADLGLSVVLIERYPSLGGTCLNVGCIPSKSLLHVAKAINEAHEVSEFGVEFAKPKLNIQKISSWKDKVLTNLTSGIKELARLRKVKTIQGTAKFLNSHQLMISSSNTEQHIINFKNAIIAAGSRANKIANLPDDPRIIDSADALELKDIPKRLLIIGGGIIGLEMAAIYNALGSKVTVAAKYDQLIPECDGDIVRPLYEHIIKKYDVYLETLVTKVEAKPDELVVHFDGNDEIPTHQAFDKILVSIGRHPNGKVLNADLAGVYIDESGFITVDKYQRTNISNIYAIGDIAGKPMLAHKAIHEGKIAAEVISGLHSRYDATVVPSVAYTDPEVAWVGLTEKQAKRKGIPYGIGMFPWAASGRALSLGRSEGKTKILFDLATDEIIGAGIVGASAGDLIAEVSLAIENRLKAHAITATIHPHPTLSETVGFATEVFESTITDLYLGNKSPKIPYTHSR